MDGTGMRAVPSPSGSNLPTFFRWCLGGIPAFASGSGSASAGDADNGASVLVLGKEMAVRCGCQIPAKQVDLLARAHFIGGEGEEEEEEEAEVFSTPPLTQQDPQRQGQSQRGQAGEGEDGITMCSMPFTQTQPSSPSSASSDSATQPSSPSSASSDCLPRKPRVCTRKVRAGTKIWPPTQTPAPAPAPAPTPSPELDPLVRAVLMIPTAPLPTSGHEDILELARSRGWLF